MKKRVRPEEFKSNEPPAKRVRQSTLDDFGLRRSGRVKPQDLLDYEFLKEVLPVIMSRPKKCKKERKAVKKHLTMQQRQ